MYIPDESIQVSEGVIVGRDYMQAVKMGLQFEDGGKVWRGESAQNTSQPFTPIPIPVVTGLAGAIVGGLRDGPAGVLRDGVLGVLVGIGIDILIKLFGKK